jgi:hypothetical protein
MPKLCRVTQKYLTPISDHCPISCSLLACFDDKTNKNKEKLEPLPGKFIWNEEAITRYKNNMQSVEVKQKLQNFINHFKMFLDHFLYWNKYHHITVVYIFFLLFYTSFYIWSGRNRMLSYRFS